MSPKTPHTAFRFDEETREKLVRASKAFNVSMTEAARRGIEAMEAFAAALPPGERGDIPMAGSYDQISALSKFLLDRDWPRGRRNPQTVWDYRCMAAAILNGEAWAIRKAWPEAAAEIVATRPA